MKKLLFGLCLLAGIVSGCGSKPLTSETLRSEWLSSYPAIRTSSFSGSLYRSLHNTDLDLRGTYLGSISHNTGTGSFSMSGHFGMANEPVSLSLSGAWSLSGDSLIIDNISGSVLFQARNQHNGSLSSRKVIYSLPTSFSHIQNILARPIPLSALTLTPHPDFYTLSLHNNNRSLTGTGSEDELTLTGTLGSESVTILYDGDMRSYRFEDYRVVLGGGENIALRHYSARSREPDVNCDMSSDLLFGKCTLMPPEGDHFTSQESLVFSWSTHLVKNAAISISD